MNRRHLMSIALVTASALSGCAGSSQTRQPIEGTWVIASATLAGAPVPVSALGDGVLHLDAGRYAFQDDRGDYVVLPGSPAALDLHGTDGPNAGRTILAIFAIDGDTMTIAYDLAGTTRPTKFESRVGTRDYLVRYRKGP